MISHDPADLNAMVNLKITWPNSSHGIGWNHILQEVSYSLDSDEVMKDIWEPTRNHGNIQEAMIGLMRVGKEDGGGMKNICQNEQFECQVTYLSIWFLQFSLSPWSSGEGRDGGRGTATSQHTQLCVCGVKETSRWHQLGGYNLQPVSWLTRNKHPWVTSGVVCASAVTTKKNIHGLQLADVHHTNLYLVVVHTSVQCVQCIRNMCLTFDLTFVQILQQCV